MIGAFLPYLPPVMAYPNTPIKDLACCLEKLKTQVAAATRDISAIQAATSVPGTVTLVAGAANIADASVTASSTLFLSRKTSAGTPGTLSWTVTAGVGFAIASSSGTDTSVLSYVIYY